MTKKWNKNTHSTSPSSTSSALILIRYSDSNNSAMEKLYYLSHRVTVALETPTEDLNDNDFFLDLEDVGGVAFEIEQMFGFDNNEDVVEEDVDDGLVE